MSKLAEVEVVLSHSERLPVVDVWLIIDILRATTVMTSWFEAGGGDLYPSESVEEALNLAASLKKDGQTPVLMGERNAIAPEGFDLGNSPLDITRDLVSRHSCAVMATTNGTKALLKAASTGRPVFAACARNAFAALNTALSRGSRIGIFCSGRKGRPAWDDTLCAGLFISRLKDYFPETRCSDSARLALLAWRGASENALPGNASVSVASVESSRFEYSVRTADHAVFLKKIGFGDDIAFASRVDATDVVPELHEQPEGDGMRAVMRPSHGEAHAILQKDLLDSPAVIKPRAAPLEGKLSDNQDGSYVFFAGKEYEKWHGNKRGPDER
ncbi:hypothetical protein AGMMS50276_01420 [Synergistales bacterium]|nr:hypothetical protein AGMMS50276_01420 [Synergistales bacterium]